MTTMLTETPAAVTPEIVDGPAAELANVVAYLVVRASDLDGIEAQTMEDARLIKALQSSVGEVFEKVDVLYKELHGISADLPRALNQYDATPESQAALWERVMGLFLKVA